MADPAAGVLELVDVSLTLGELLKDALSNGRNTLSDADGEPDGIALAVELKPTPGV